MNGITKLLVYCVITIACIGCKTKSSENPSPTSPPPPAHPGMCTVIDLGEASDAVKKALPDNQLVSIQGMSSPQTLVWQDVQTQQIYFATKIMGAEGKLFYMEKLKTGQKPGIRSSFTGTILLWKHLPPSLLNSMKRQFKEQWGVTVDENVTYILKANEKPVGCK